MSLLYYLPISGFISFVVAFGMYLTVFKNCSNRKYKILFILKLGTGLAISIIEMLFLMLYFGATDAVIQSKMIFYLIILLINVGTTIAKGVIIRNNLVPFVKDSELLEVTDLLNVVDILTLVGFGLALLVFRA